MACHSTPQRLPTYLLRKSRLQPLWSPVIPPTCCRVFVLCTLLPGASSSASLSSSSYQLSEVFLTNLSLTSAAHSPLSSLPTLNLLSFSSQHLPPDNIPTFLFISLWAYVSSHENGSLKTAKTISFTAVLDDVEILPQNIQCSLNICWKNECMNEKLSQTPGNHCSKARVSKFFL